MAVGSHWLATSQRIKYIQICQRMIISYCLLALLVATTTEGAVKGGRILQDPVALQGISEPHVHVGKGGGGGALHHTAVVTDPVSLNPVVVEKVTSLGSGAGLGPSSAQFTLADSQISSLGQSRLYRVGQSQVPFGLSGLDYYSYPTSLLTRGRGLGGKSVFADNLSGLSPIGYGRRSAIIADPSTSQFSVGDAQISSLPFGGRNLYRSGISSVPYGLSGLDYYSYPRNLLTQRGLLGSGLGQTKILSGGGFTAGDSQVSGLLAEPLGQERVIIESGPSVSGPAIVQATQDIVPEQVTTIVEDGGYGQRQVTTVTKSAGGLGGLRGGQIILRGGGIGGGLRRVKSRPVIQAAAPVQEVLVDATSGLGAPFGGFGQRQVAITKSVAPAPVVQAPVSVISTPVRPVISRGLGEAFLTQAVRPRIAARRVVARPVAQISQPRVAVIQQGPGVGVPGNIQFTLGNTQIIGGPSPVISAPRPVVAVQRPVVAVQRPTYAVQRPAIVQRPVLAVRQPQVVRQVVQQPQVIRQVVQQPQVIRQVVQQPQVQVVQQPQVIRQVVQQPQVQVVQQPQVFRQVVQQPQVQVVQQPQVIRQVVQQPQVVSQVKTSGFGGRRIFGRRIPQMYYVDGGSRFPGIDIIGGYRIGDPRHNYGRLPISTQRFANLGLSQGSIDAGPILVAPAPAPALLSSLSGAKTAISQGNSLGLAAIGKTSPAKIVTEEEVIGPAGERQIVTTVTDAGPSKIGGPAVGGPLGLTGVGQTKTVTQEEVIGPAGDSQVITTVTQSSPSKIGGLASGALGLTGVGQGAQTQVVTQEEVIGPAGDRQVVTTVTDAAPSKIGGPVVSGPLGLSGIGQTGATKTVTQEEVIGPAGDSQIVTTVTQSSPSKIGGSVVSSPFGLSAVGQSAPTKVVTQEEVIGPAGDSQVVTTITETASTPSKIGGQAISSPFAAPTKVITQEEVVGPSGDSQIITTVSETSPANNIVQQEEVGLSALTASPLSQIAQDPIETAISQSTLGDVIGQSALSDFSGAPISQESISSGFGGGLGYAPRVSFLSQFPYDVPSRTLLRQAVTRPFLQQEQQQLEQILV